MKFFVIEFKILPFYEGFFPNFLFAIAILTVLQDIIVTISFFHFLLDEFDKRADHSGKAVFGLDEVGCWSQ